MYILFPFCFCVAIREQAGKSIGKWTQKSLLNVLSFRDPKYNSRLLLSSSNNTYDKRHVKLEFPGRAPSILLISKADSTNFLSL